MSLTSHDPKSPPSITWLASLAWTKAPWPTDVQVRTFQGPRDCLPGGYPDRDAIRLVSGETISSPEAVSPYYFRVSDLKLSPNLAPHPVWGSLGWGLSLGRAGKPLKSPIRVTDYVGGLGCREHQSTSFCLRRSQPGRRRNVIISTQQRDT